MAAEVDAAHVVMEDIDLLPLSALPPLSPSSIRSLSSSSALSTSTPSSPIDSDALSATSSSSHDVDCAMLDCVSGSATVQSDKLTDEQQQSISDDSSLDDGDIEHLLPVLGDVSTLHPLGRTAFDSRLSFSHFVHFLNRPEPSLQVTVHASGQGLPSEFPLQQPCDSPPLSTTARQPLSPTHSDATPAGIRTAPPSPATTAAQSTFTAAPSGATFTLESATNSPLPIVTPSSIHDDYALQQRRLLRVKSKPSLSPVQPLTAMPAAAQPVDTFAAAVISRIRASSTASPPPPPPAAEPRRRSRTRAPSSARRRKRSQPAVKSNLVITFKRVRAAPQQSPSPSTTSGGELAASHAPPAPAPRSQPDANDGTPTSTVGGKPVVEGREERKTRLLWEHFEALERQEKEKQARMEWQVTQQEPPIPERAAASATKAADTADDILSAAERHDERLARIEAAPLLTPTVDEFRNPMRYIRYIVNKHRQYGVVCIRPPAGWRPAYEYSLDREGLSFPCKRQVIKRYYGQEKKEEAAKEERKEEDDSEATARKAASHLDAIALQVSAFSYQERLTMAEFRRDEAQRRVEWEQMRARWQHKADKRSQERQQQPTQAQSVAPPAGAVMAQLVTETPSLSNMAVSSLPSQIADAANPPTDVAARKVDNSSSTVRDRSQTGESLDVSYALTISPVATSVAAEAAVASAQLVETRNDTDAPAAAVAVVMATPVLATPPPPPPYAAPTHAQVESEYWRWAMLYGKNRPTVYYANDVDTHPEQRTPLPPLPPESPLLTSPPSPYHPWDLSTLNSLPSSFLHHLNRSIPGITAPMLYIGMLHSTFCWHHEDHHLYSISYNHAGSLPKTWYGVPGSHCAAVEELANNHLYPFFDSTRSHLLARKTSMFTPVLLHEAGIPVYRAVQEEGMFVITFPRAYHCGFSHGYSLAESVNFALDDWLPDGGEATRMYRLVSQFPVVPFTELVVRAVETAVREGGSAEYEDDMRVDGLARLERTFAELVLHELNEREQLYGSGRHPRLSFAHLRCDSATRYCKACLHATYLSHVRCDCRLGGGVCLSGHGLCRVHREESEVVLAYTSIELITLLSDLQSAMLNVKKLLREKRAAEGGADASAEDELLSEVAKADVKLRNERFDQCVALETSLSDRECKARDMHLLLADQHDDDEDDDRPRRRMSGSGAGSGGGTGRRRKKRLLDTEAEQSPASAPVQVIAHATDATPMAVDAQPSAMHDAADTTAAADEPGEARDERDAVSGPLAEEAVDAAPFASQEELPLVTQSAAPAASPESATLVSQMAAQMPVS